MAKPAVVVAVAGGVVYAVLSNIADVTVDVVDWDQFDGADEEEIEVYYRPLADAKVIVPGRYGDPEQLSDNWEVNEEAYPYALY